MKEVTEDFIQHSIKQDHHWNLIYTPALLKAQGNSQGSREYKGLYHVGELYAHLGLEGNEFRMYSDRAKVTNQG